LTFKAARRSFAHVFTLKSDRPYFDAWLRRTGRQFAVSGRLTQTAHLLSVQEGGSVDDWSSRLRTLMLGEEVPSLDLLTKIDLLLAGPQKPSASEAAQGMLF
jgi:hypothetical protein